jgi:putative SOS response-associated peptidase YedK
MCGRLVSGSDERSWREWVEILRPRVVAPPPPERGARPSDELAVVLGDRGTETVEIAAARWGLQLPGDDRLFFNTRLETVERRFKEEVRDHRALVPVSAFQIAEGRAGDRDRARHLVHGERALLLAGLWTAGAHGAPPRVSVLTRQARGDLAALHARTPVFVPAALARGWLVGADVHALVTELLALEDPPLSVGPATRSARPARERGAPRRQLSLL